MNLERIHRLIERVEECDPHFEKQPASDLSITAVEERLSVTFPESYRTFLRHFGSFYSCDQAVSGIYCDDPTELGSGSIVGDTLRFREEYDLPPQFMVIQPDEDAPYCLDLSTAASEPSVVCFQLNTKTYQEITPNFESWFIEWFLEELVDLLEDDS